MIKLAFFLVKYLFSNKYRVIIAFSSKIDYLCFRVIQLCEVWGIRLIDFRNQFVTHPFLSLILQFVNQRDSLNGNNHTIYRLHIPTDGQKRNNKIKEGNTASIRERGIRNGCPALTEPAPPGSGRHLSSHSNSYPSRLPVCSLESSLRELNCSTVTSFDTL